MTSVKRSSAMHDEAAPHAAARLIVSETEPRWAPALRRAIGRRAESLVECRSLAECGQLVASWPASLVALELSAERFGETLSWLSRLDRRHPQARAVVLGAPEAAELRTVLLEAGAVCLVDSPRNLEEMADLARRHWSRLPKLPIRITELTMAQLPWGSAADRSTATNTHGEADDVSP